MLARIIDANINRAREALRLMEDLARFGRDDANLAQRLKQLRHDLRDAVEALPPSLGRGQRLASRDTDGDVGASISTTAEGRRGSPADLAAAAGARASEALRALEEGAKAADAPAHAFEALRYRLYEAERLLGLALPPRQCPQFKFCILITESLCLHHPWEDVARAAIRGGADCLQLREKHLDSAELLRRARELVAIAREDRVSGKESGGRGQKAGGGGSSARDRHESAVHPASAVIINDRPDIALLAGADGVHLGQTDFPIAEARKLVGFNLWIGISTTNLDQARAAVRAGADYCGIGPMFPTTTKHKPEIAGSSYLCAYLADPLLAAIPHLAIGGITPDNVGELRESGCRGIAVSAAVCSARDPELVCRQLFG